MDIVKQCILAAGYSGQAMLDSNTWRRLGYGRRPIVGSFFQRFRKPWKVALEKRISNELFSLFCAAHALAWQLPSHEAPMIMATAIYRSDEAAHAMGFSTADEAAEATARRISEYMKSPVSDWHMLLSVGINLFGIADRKLVGRMTMGISIFCTEMRHLVGLLADQRPKE